MQGRVFQNTLVQLKREVQRTLGVIDDSDTIIACSDEDKIGNTVDNIFTVFSATGEVKTVAGACYKKIETFSKCEFVVFLRGRRRYCQKCVFIPCCELLTIKQYYDENMTRQALLKILSLIMFCREMFFIELRNFILMLSAPELFI